MRALTACLLLIVWLPAQAAEMRNVKVSHERGRYEMQSEVLFDVGLEALYDVFLDYDLSPQFSSWIVEARDLEPDELGRPGYFIHNRGCVLFICKSVVRQGHVEHEPFSRIAAIADPEKSDFEVSNETWTFRQEPDGVVVIYRLEMVPKFWVPPVIGPMVIKRKLKSSGGDALDRIEEIARARESE